MKIIAPTSAAVTAHIKQLRQLLSFTSPAGTISGCQINQSFDGW